MLSLFKARILPRFFICLFDSCFLKNRKIKLIGKFTKEARILFDKSGTNENCFYCRAVILVLKTGDKIHVLKP